MEYLISADGPFHQIEDQTIKALHGQGFVVQRTFSLDSATAGVNGSRQPGFSVLMLYADSDLERPLGALTLHGQAGQVLLRAMLGSSAPDTEAELVVALILAKLDFCVNTAGGLGCIEPSGQAPDPA